MIYFFLISFIILIHGLITLFSLFQNYHSQQMLKPAEKLNLWHARIRINKMRCGFPAIPNNGLYHKAEISVSGNLIHITPKKTRHFINIFSFDLPLFFVLSHKDLKQLKLRYKAYVAVYYSLSSWNSKLIKYNGQVNHYSIQIRFINKDGISELAISRGWQDLNRGNKKILTTWSLAGKRVVNIIKSL